MWQGSAPSEELEIVLPHIKLGALRWGNADKPILLALHGWLDNANSFVPLAEQLSDSLSDHQIIAIDWPGHGQSDHRPGLYPLHWIDYIFDLEVLIETLSKQQPIAAIVGHSLGGIVAAAYTASFSDRVPKLILLEAISPLYEEAHNASKRLNKSFAGHLKFLGGLKRPSPVYKDIDVAVTARARLTGMDKQWCRMLVSRNMRHVDTGVSWRSDPRLKLDSPMRLTFEQVNSVMQHIDTPTLLITAEEGLSYLQQALPQAKHWFNNLEHIVLAGDHHLHMGNSSAVAESVHKFLTLNGEK